MRTGLDFGETSHEQRLADIDQLMGWSHPGRKAQRVIAGTLFLSGSVWAVLLILSLFVLVGIVFNVIFVFGWLIYGGWFYVMIGKPMSVSLRFFWMASIVIHAGYGWLFSPRNQSLAKPPGDSIEFVFQSGWAWWSPMIASAVALACESWALRSYSKTAG
jgi:hypothetical protein